ncbi:MAG: hypothetical protein U9O94_05890 [Nanoarchaeota archaeon]|nr:hypothetical protein [Nanoarchaeota archaeon]
MGFIADIIETVVDVIIDIVTIIVDIVILVVEVVLDILAMLLGLEDPEDTIISTYAVQNIPLFDDTDKKNPLLNVILRAILQDEDITEEILYMSTFRSMKGNLKKFIKYIDDGDYYEDFPTLESHITYVDYEELSNALQTLTGVPCTAEQSKVGSLIPSAWMKYWLQENKGYDVGNNTLPGGEYREINTSSGNSTDTVTISSGVHTRVDLSEYNHTSDAVTGTDINVSTSPATTPDNLTKSTGTHHIITISDHNNVSDSVLVDTRWHIDFGSMTYDEITETYNLDIYNDAGVTIPLPYTIPKKPLNMHYTSYYYKDSNPNRTYIFVYKVGEGTYPDLDDPENPVNEDPSNYKTIPAIPLRISNTNFTSFEASKKEKIIELLSILNMDGEAMLDSVLNEPGADPGDIDNIYVNFGVRMWDTTQAGMSYLFNMFQNLYSTQGVTQGTYDSTPEEDTKPYNKLIVTATDYKYAFQFAYVKFQHTTLAEIDADTGSAENGIYYSDMSKFNDAGDLVYTYYSSSGKGTYNVGYKADNLAEVNAFLAGNGVVNPGDTTAEASNWLQVTERISYTAELQDAEGNVTDVIYLTPDMVYENVGGILRMVLSASEETTAGQSITYYECTPSGLNAYTVVAPMAALRVEDGATGHFEMVKFNLGNRDDLMVPLIYAFINELSIGDLSKLFLSGSHLSIYIAHYEVIKARKFNLLKMLVMILIIIVIIVVVSMFLTPAGGATAGGSATTTASTMTVSGAPVAEGVAVTTVSTEAGVVATVGGEALAAGSTFTLTNALGVTCIYTVGAAGVATLAIVPMLIAVGTKILIATIIKEAISAIVGDNIELQLALNVAVMIFMLDPSSTAEIAVTTTRIFAHASHYMGGVMTEHAESRLGEMQQEWDEYLKEYTKDMNVLEDIQRSLLKRGDGTDLALLDMSQRVRFNPMSPESYFAYEDAKIDLVYNEFDFDHKITRMIDIPAHI